MLETESTLAWFASERGLTIASTCTSHWAGGFGAARSQLRVTPRRYRDALGGHLCNKLRTSPNGHPTPGGDRARSRRRLATRALILSYEAARVPEPVVVQPPLVRGRSPPTPACDLTLTVACGGYGGSAHGIATGAREISGRDCGSLSVPRCRRGFFNAGDVLLQNRSHATYELSGHTSHELTIEQAKLRLTTEQPGS